MAQRLPTWIRLATTVFRTCEWCLPRNYRERFGWEAEDSFRTLVTETLERDGSRAAARAAAAACGDLARTGLRERTAGWSGTIGSGLTGDVVQSLRIYRREPLLGGAIALILAFVAGPTVAIFAILYNLVLAPLPYRDAGRLVVVTQLENYYLRTAQVADYRGVDAFAAVHGIRPLIMPVIADGPSEFIPSVRATAGLLTELGVPFAAGRDVARGEDAMVVVTRPFALARFGTEAAAIGKVISVTNSPMTIVGVTAIRPPLLGPLGADLFTTYPAADSVNPPRRGSQAIIIARLKPGVSQATALAQTQAMTTNVQTQFGEPRADAALVPLRVAISGPNRTPLLILFGVAAIVFIVAVTSLAGLLMARVAARAQDITVRTWLGASRWRLVRAWLTDGLAFVAPGIALGVWIGDSLLTIVRAKVPSQMFQVPDLVAAWPMVGGAVALAAVSVLLFGLTPVGLGPFKVRGLGSRASAYQIAGSRHARSQSMLIAIQVAVSFVLVASSIWLANSLWQRVSRPIGFDPQNLIFVSVTMPPVSRGPGETPDSPNARLKDLVHGRIGQLVTGAGDGVAASSAWPGVNANRFAASRIRSTQPILPQDDRPVIALNQVSFEYFRVLGIPIVEGRPFTEADESAGDTTAIVSRSFAQRWFPEGALGQFVSLGSKDRREIIGLVEDISPGRARDENLPQLYLPYRARVMGPPSEFLVRTSLAADTIRNEVTSLAKALSPNATVRVLSAEDALAQPLLLQRLASQFTIALGFMAMLLAVVSIYALSAFAVVQRTREIGVRLALGATIAQTLRLVMARALGWAGAGLVVGGLVTFFVAAPVLQRQLYETSAHDPRLLALAFTLVAAIASVAAWIPARRAATIDPALTLRAE